MESSNTTRRQLLGLIGGASAAALTLTATQSHAQSMGLNFVSIEPRFDKLSEEVRSRLGATLLKQSLYQSLNPVSGPQPCDDTSCDYSEFWAETRPKDSSVPVFSDPNDPVQNAIEQMAWNNLGPSTQKYEWSEEQFLEVKPQWDEMQPASTTQKQVNAVVRMRLVEDGVTVQDKNFYSNVLQALYRSENE